MPKDHAILSPSSAFRWLHCTAAPRLEEKEKDTSSSFAKEGTLAHAYCAKKLKSHLNLPTTDEDKEIKELHDEYHTGEMDEYTDHYLSEVFMRFVTAKVKTPDAELFVEKHLDFSMYIPESFGTADSIIVADDLMEIIDFKYGKGVRVEAEKNPQIMIYALGAYEAYSFDYNIKRVRMTIIQPRLDNTASYDLTVPELLAWANKIKPIAQKAFAGGGNQVPGDWCQFCKVKNYCKPLTDTCLDTTTRFGDAKIISKKDIETRILPQMKMIKSWLTSIQSYVLDKALSGVKYKGYKLVEGRSMRQITDPEKVGRILTNLGYDKNKIYKPIAMQPITELEKLCGKHTFDRLCKDFIHKPQGKPALVPETDKRDEFNAPQDDFASIKI